MPTGHTDKQTLTPYRAALLKRLPLNARWALSAAERHQVNQMSLFGWIEKQLDGSCSITELGRKVLRDSDRAALEAQP